MRTIMKHTLLLVVTAIVYTLFFSEMVYLKASSCNNTDKSNNFEVITIVGEDGKSETYTRELYEKEKQSDNSKNDRIMKDTESETYLSNKVDYITIRANMQYGQTEARRMLDMINDFRTGQEAWAWNEDNTKKIQYSNLSKISYDYKLEKVAMQRAAEVAISFCHTRPNGESCFSLYDNMSGENIAAGQSSVEKVFEAWKETDEGYEGQGHRRNMLGGHEAVGIGHVYFHGAHFWVQEFGNPLSNTAKTVANDSEKTVDIETKLSTCNITALADTDEISLSSNDDKSLPGVDYHVTTGCTFYNNLDTVDILETEWNVTDSNIAAVNNGKIYGISSGMTNLELNIGDRNILSIPVTVSDGDCVHTFGAGVVTQKESCTRSGQMKYVCTKCGYTYYNSIAPSGHKWDEGSQADDDYGFTFHCKECGIDYSSESIHKEATIYVDGSYSYSTAFKLLNAFNAKRKSNGLNTVIMNPDLLSIGMKHASDLTVCLSTTNNPDGTTFEMGSGCGNVCARVNGYESALDGICKNLANYKKCYSVGIGVFIQNGYYYLCVVFGTYPDEYTDEVEQSSYTDKKQTVEIFTQGNGYDFSIEAYNTDTGKEEDIYDMQPGKKAHLRVIKWPVAIINPKSYTGWKSTDPNVISVDSSGCITAKKDGSAIIYCMMGDYIVQRNVDVYDENLHLERISLSKKEYAYTGKAIKPSVTVYNGNYKKIPANYYAVTYSKNIDVGKGKITVTGKNGYKGSLKESFKILPKGTKLLKVKGKKRSVVIKWKKQPKQIDGYEIQYHIGKKFAQTNKIIRINNPSAVKKVIKKLKKGKRYCVRIRTYKKLKVNTYYSTWSKTLTTLVK